MMRPQVPSLSALMAAGVQWGRLHGHHTREMRTYLLPDAAHRWRYNVFDVPCATMPMLDEALAFLESVAASGKDVLFVGTTPAARHAVSIAAQRCGSPYVVMRWVGGTLSNSKSILRAIALLEDTAAQPAATMLTGAAAKKAAMVAAKRRERAERKVGGLRGMTRLPGAVFVVDAARHANVLAEAKTMSIPVCAVCDSDTQHPLELAYPIPANASSPASVRLLAELAARAVLYGKKLEPPEATWERDMAEKRMEEGEEHVASGEEEELAFNFFGTWRVAPLRTSLSGTGRRRGHKRHRLTGGLLGRTQRRLQ